MSIDIAETARRLAAARQAQRRIVLPPALRPTQASDAYAIQDEIGRILRATVHAWKVGAPDPHTEPNAAPIYRLLRSPACIAVPPLGLIGVEAELAAVLARPLPARAEAYEASEVLAATQEVVVAIEVCDSRMDDWQAADDTVKLADHQLNFALVTGDGTPSFARMDLGALDVRTCINGTVVKQGTAAHPVGNPLRLLAWLANHARTRGGMPTGTVITTGAWLGVHPVAPGDEVKVDFPAIGSALISFQG